MYNPYAHIVVNRKEILYNEDINPEAYRSLDLTLVSFQDIPQDIIDRAIGTKLS